MFYKLINFPLVVGLCALGIFLLHKTKINRKKLISVLWCVLVVFLNTVFPIENAVVTFDSPESVVLYTKGLGSVDVIDGEKSCVVVSKKDANTYTDTFVLKKDDGYKIAYYFSVQLLCREQNTHGIFTVYKVRNTYDYYLSSVGYRQIDEIEIYDQNDAPINYEIHNTESLGTWIYFKGLSDGYYMIIEGERIDF